MLIIIIYIYYVIYLQNISDIFNVKLCPVFFSFLLQLQATLLRHGHCWGFFLSDYICNSIIDPHVDAFVYTTAHRTSNYVHTLCLVLHNNNY